MRGRVWLDKRTRGRPAWCIIWKDLEGLQHRERTEATSKSEALALLNAKQSELVIAKVTGATLQEVKVTPFSEFLKTFMKAEEAKVGQSNGYTEATFKGYQRLEECVREWFGARPIQQIDHKLMREFYRDMIEEKETAATANRHLSFVSTILTGAMARDLIESNPARNVQKEPEDSFKLRYYTEHEARHILPFLPGWLRPMFTLALHCGLRRSELCRLTWGAVDFLAGRITITEAKNRKVQTVPMNAVARKLLEGMKPASETWQKSAYVFSDPKGEPWDADSVTHAYRKAAIDAGIEGTTFHTTRHTCASWMAQRGVPLKAVQEILRHGSMDVTMRYAHLSPGNLDDAVAVLAKSGTPAVQAARRLRKAK